MDNAGEPDDEPSGPESSRPDAPARSDVLFVHGANERGDGYRVIRTRDATLEVGELRTVRDGRPIHGEVVKLTPRKEHERLFDVEVLAKGPEQPADAKPAAARSGPAQVATDAYRENWDAIFGRRDKLN